MIASLDLETSCGVKDCPGYGNSNSSKCEHAVHHMQNKIDIIGVYDGKTYRIFREVPSFDAWRNKASPRFLGHGIKFDYKTLKAHGSGITLREIVGDTQLLGSVVFHKVPASYLKKYNEQRKVLNAALPPKQKHRDGKPLSLKTMAPFYLGVDAFWENPATHDDPEYNKKDCIYTFDLHAKLLGSAEHDGTLKFYQDKLLPWTKLLAEAEYEGVLIDEPQLHKLYATAIGDTKRLETVVHSTATEAFSAYKKKLIRDLEKDNKTRCDSYISKRLKDKSKSEGVRKRYAESLAERIAQLPTTFNLNSPDQMKVLLGYHGVNMDIEKRDKETNEWIEKEGTDKFVLIRSKVRQKLPIARALLEYRQKNTEVGYLKQYINACVGGRIYCTFNATGTRTGRLSSAGPNLQNVKGVLRGPFIIADPKKYSIYTVDSSQIEPRLVAYYTQDQEMVLLFVEGRDYHNYATKKFFPKETTGCAEKDVKKSHEHLRKTAKIGDLSIIYGTGHYTFQTMCLVREEMDIPLDRCKDMVMSFREGMKGVFGWKKNLEESYNKGHRVFTFMGRPVQARDSSSVHMTLFNTDVQGSASDLVVDASLLARRRFYALGIDAKPLAWIHDEVVWRFPKGKEAFCKATVDYYMKAYKLDTPHGRVPLDCEGKVASCWEK